MSEVHHGLLTPLRASPGCSINRASCTFSEFILPALFSRCWPCWFQVRCGPPGLLQRHDCFDFQPSTEIALPSAMRVIFTRYRAKAGSPADSLPTSGVTRCSPGFPRFMGSYTACLCKWNKSISLQSQAFLSCNLINCSTAISCSIF